MKQKQKKRVFIHPLVMSPPQKEKQTKPNQRYLFTELDCYSVLGG